MKIPHIETGVIMYGSMSEKVFLEFFFLSPRSASGLSQQVVDDLLGSALLAPACGV